MGRMEEPDEVDHTFYIDEKQEVTVTWGAWCDHKELPLGMYQDEVEAFIVNDLVKSGRVIYGSEHQNKPNGCPYLNGEPMAFSMRGWGRVMATARNVAEKTNKYSYCNFAWYRD